MLAIYCEQERLTGQSIYLEQVTFPDQLIMRFLRLRKKPVQEKFTKETYSAYVMGKEFREKRKKFKEMYPFSYYCVICDCQKFLNLHHIDYSNIPNEQWSDFAWLCDPRCGCQNNCHYKAHKNDAGEMIPKERLHLQPRLKELRQRYIRENLRSSTLIYFVKRSLYRIFY